MSLPPLKTFIIYSRDDVAFKNQLLVHLRQFVTLGWIEKWEDSDLLPGEEWEKRIEEELESAHLVIMLVSAYALDSEFIRKKELKIALEKKSSGTARVIPILVRDCLWEIHPDLSTLQFLPKDENSRIWAVESWKSSSAAWSAALRELKNLIEAVQKELEKERIAKETANKAEEEARQKKAEAEKAEKKRHLADEKTWEHLQKDLESTLDLAEKIALLEAYRDDPAHQNHRSEAVALIETLEAEQEAARRREAARVAAKQKKEAAEKVRREAEAEVARKKAEEEAQKLFIPEMVLVKGGTFQMGGDENGNKKPIHKVTLSDFYIGKYPITVAAFRAFIEESGFQTDADKEGISGIWTGSGWEDKKNVNWKCDVASKIRSEQEDRHPVIHVSWNDATAYCKWLSEKAGKNYRLPTEAEWEYAARGGVEGAQSNFLYAGGNDLKEVGWFKENAGGKTHPVGEKQPNTLGLFDMSGNVWEWCADWHDSNYYKNSLVSNPQGPASGSFRVIRGGSWGSVPQSCRVAYRGNYTPGYRNNLLGFRLARTN